MSAHRWLRYIAPSVSLLLAGPALPQTHFTEVGYHAGVADSVGVSAQASWGDYDNDGILEVLR